MAFVVLYDACVLHPPSVRDLLIRVALTGIVQARWSDPILDECFQSIRERRPDLSPEALDRTRDLMNATLPGALVWGFDDLIGGLTLPDPDDRHVLAAAIRGNAQAIVTFNLEDFPAEALAPYDIEAKHPDDFIMDSLHLAPAAVAAAIAEQAAALHNPPRSVAEVLDTLRDHGLGQSVARLREQLGIGVTLEDPTP